MDHRGDNNGLETLLEHWSIPLIAAVAYLTCQAFMFFTRLSGMPWIWFFVGSFLLLFIGAGLIVYSKLPAYRAGRFLTFGPKSVPGELRMVYRWGWRVFFFGAVLGLCLLLSRP